MDPLTPTDLGGRIVLTEGLLGRILKRPTEVQPVGRDDEQWMRVSALMIEGLDIHFTTIRPPDITGARPIWYEFAYNVGDIDQAPVVVPLGPRHRSIEGW